MALFTYDDDDGLLDELRRVFRTADPVPAPVRDAALAAFERRTGGPGAGRPSPPGPDSPA